MLLGCLSPVVVVIRIADRVLACFTSALVGRFCMLTIRVRLSLASVNRLISMSNLVQGYGFYQ